MKKIITTTALAIAALSIGFTSCEKIEKTIDDFDNQGFNAETFKENLIKACDGKTVGYSFAIGKDGQVLFPTAGGNARMAIDGEVKYTTETRIGVGSTSKTITALAILKALEKKGLDETALIKDFLPTGWVMPKENLGITFKDVLAHEAGLQNFGGDYPALKKTVETKTTGIGNRDYDNMNYTLCRVLLAYLVRDRKDLESGFDPNWLTCAIYRDYVRDEIFKPAGVKLWDKIDIGPWSETAGPTGDLQNTLALYYNYSMPTLNGVTRMTTLLEAGPGGWYMNPTEEAQVMIAAEGGKIVSKDMMTRMKEKLMGFDAPIRAEEHGNYYFKNGVWGDGQSRGIYTVIMHFPNNVQVVWHTNSRVTDLGSPEDLIIDAYDAAWK